MDDGDEPPKNRLVLKPEDLAAPLRLTDEEILTAAQENPPGASDSAAIRLTEADICAVEPIIITPQDLASVLALRPEDMPQVLVVRRQDLPQALKIDLADLPEDMDGAATQCYHGTSWAAAESIQKQGFRVGSGMGAGAGVYFSVGAWTIAEGYVKSSRPCIIRARVDWGRVAYLDDPKLPAAIRSASGEAKTKAALARGYHSFLCRRKCSVSNPTVGIILGTRGSYVGPPRITVVELLDVNKLRRK